MIFIQELSPQNGRYTPLLGLHLEISMQKLKNSTMKGQKSIKHRFKLYGTRETRA